MAASRPRRLCSPRRARYHPPLRRGEHASASARDRRQANRGDGSRATDSQPAARPPGTPMPSRIVTWTYREAQRLVA
jgi:hypothetical protein